MHKQATFKSIKVFIVPARDLFFTACTYFTYLNALTHWIIHSKLNISCNQLSKNPALPAAKCKLTRPTHQKIKQQNRKFSPFSS